VSDPGSSDASPPQDGWRPWPTGSDQEAVETRAPTRRGTHADALPEHPRYVFSGVVGRGGEGIVYRARDAELERDVAVKTLRPQRVSPESIEAFVDEARAAASLEHPHIIPIHDLGTLRDGRPFFSMKLVTGRVLSQVLASDGDDEWTLVRLVQVVQQVSLALQYAHERGLLHRDVKPSNILLGRFGEVFLVDWGIARHSRGPQRETTTGVIKGTLSYMSPEQARGAHVDARADVYSLGAVLYQVLARHVPFEHESGAELVAAILRDVPPPPQEVAPGRAIPPELAQLALRALDKDAAARPQSAREVHDILQGFVEGVLDRRRRMDEADGACARGVELLVRHRAAVELASSLSAEVSRLERLHPSWQPIPEKRDLLEAREGLEHAREVAESSFVAAADAFGDAVAHLSDHSPARKALADMHWERFREAEHAGDSAAARAHRAVVERYHDGRLVRQLSGEGSLRVKLEPARARWRLVRLVERNLVFCDGPEVQAGVGNVEMPRLDMGSYVLVAEADGHEPARYPICIERNTDWDSELRLLREGDLPPGFVYVPGTEAWLGGDPRATNSWPLRRVRIGSFAIARFPVTFGEYCDFLDAQAGRAGCEALIPRTEDGGPLCRRGADGRFEPDLRLTVGLPAESPAGSEWRRYPVFGVSQAEAAAHARHLSERLARELRLPTAEERELVGRGVDRREHPWGRTHDATLAWGRDSRAGGPQISVVGSAAGDTSVHGVRDLAGGIQEMTSSWFDAAQLLNEVRGGGWGSGAGMTRGAWRGAASADMRNQQLGYRFACSTLVTAAGG
jgi:serine/threonine-protein kinase